MYDAVRFKWLSFYIVANIKIFSITYLMSLMSTKTNLDRQFTLNFWWAVLVWH